MQRADEILRETVFRQMTRAVFMSEIFAEVELGKANVFVNEITDQVMIVIKDEFESGRS